MINPLYILFIILISSVLGSFFNMLIHRLPRNQEIVKKPSHCPKCQHKLTWLDLLPILSYLFLKGRCRYCREKIASRYLLVEISSVFLFTTCWLIFGPTYLFLKYSFFLSIMLLIFFTDLETKKIPDSLNYILICTGLFLAFYEHSIIDSILGLIIGSFIFLSIGFLAKLYYKKDALGGGDVKLSGAIGAYWGLSIMLFSIYFSFLIGGLVSIFLIILKKKTNQDYIAFGPFMVLGSILALLISDYLIILYF
jgi:leader peptidase (prepilin peptidase) / N-methyltransferase